MSQEAIEQRVSSLEEKQKEFVLREVFDIFKEDMKDTKTIVHQNRATNLKLVGALVLFKVVYAPLVFFVLKTWIIK